MACAAVDEVAHTTPVHRPANHAPTKTLGIPAVEFISDHHFEAPWNAILPKKTGHAPHHPCIYTDNCAVGVKNTKASLILAQAACLLGQERTARCSY